MIFIYFLRSRVSQISAGMTMPVTSGGNTVGGTSMDFSMSVRLKQFAVIEFLTAENVPPAEIHRRMKAVYGDECVDLATLHHWAKYVADAHSAQTIEEKDKYSVPILGLEIQQELQTYRSNVQETLPSTSFGFHGHDPTTTFFTAAAATATATTVQEDDQVRKI